MLALFQQTLSITAPTVATFFSFGLAWLYSLYRCPRVDRGVFTQGTFRGNAVLMGVALAGIIVLLYNSLFVIILEIYGRQSRMNWPGVFRRVYASA